MRVSSAEFVRNFGNLSDKALGEAVTITRNGRDRLVLLSVDEYERLKRRDRRVIRLDEFTDADMQAIAVSGMSPDHAGLDEELADWRP